MIFEADAIFFTQQIYFGKKSKSSFIAEPCSDFNRCYAQRILENFESRLILVLSTLDASYMSILRTNYFHCVFRYYYDVNPNTVNYQIAENAKP